MITDVVCWSFESEICIAKRSYLVEAASGPWHIATIRMREANGCPVELVLLFANRFLTILCGSHHGSDTGCGAHAQDDELGDHYRHHFLWPKITISRLFY